MSSSRRLGSGRVAVAAAVVAALSAADCGGRSQDAAAAAGSTGSAGVRGGADASGGSSAHGGQPSRGQSGGDPGGASSSAGQPSVAGAGGLGGDSDGWTLPPTSEKPWRQSVEPLCLSDAEYLPWDLWSDERGLYVLAESGLGARRLHFNDGTGWSDLRQGQPSVGLSGFANGALVLYGGSPCGVVFRDGDVDVCATTLPNISRAFVVDSDRTFAVSQNRVFRYNGEYFVQYAKPLPQDNPGRPYGFWADAEVVIAATDQGHVYILPDANSEAEVLTLPDSAAAHALWAFGRDDIWVGLEENRLAHYDGASWTVQRVSELGCGTVTSLWGIDHVLFFAGPTIVGKVQDGVAQTLAASSQCPPDRWTPARWEELSVGKIWGNSPTEVFFSVSQRKLEVKQRDEYLETSVLAPDACGMQRVYWYDGTRIRPL